MQEISITNEWLIENGVAAGAESHGLTLTYCDLAKAYPLLYNDMKNNNGANTLSFENYELDWSKEKTIPFELGGLAQSLKINEIFRDAFDDESIEVSDATTANDIADWDSLMQMNLIEMVEDEFGFQFSMDEAAGLKNVGSMVDVVLAHC